MRRARRPIAVTVAGFVLGGLGVLGGAVGCSLEPISGVCEGDVGCPDESVCAFGLCVDPGALENVDLEVEPTGTSDVPTQNVFDVSTVAGNRVDVTLQPRATLIGQVVDDDGEAIGATVFASPQRIIPGRVRQPSVVVDEARYELPLIRGQSYRLLAQPDDPSLPPTAPSDPIEAGRDDAPVLAVRADVTVRGFVVAGEGAAAIAQTGVEVFIVDDAGRRVSSLAAIGDDVVDGAFTLRLQSGVVGARLVVRPQQADGRPTLSLPITLDAAGDFDLGALSLGVAGRVVLSGQVRTSSGAPAAQAVVVLRGQVGAGVTTVRTTTGDDGTFRLSLSPGSYSAAAVANDNGGGLVVTTLDVVEGRDDLVFTLAPRITSTLRLTTAEGLSVPLSSVVMTRVGNVDGLAEPVLGGGAQPAFLGAADDTGTVVLAVDPGRYRISIVPPRGTGVPVFSVSLTVADDSERTIALPPATILAGTLTGGQGGGAYVRVFSEVTDEVGRAILLGETIAEADGTFAVPLPDISNVP